MSTLVAQTISNGTVSTSSANVIQGSAKAWVNWVGSTGVILASYNVSSITLLSTGRVKVNFTNSFANANYAFTGSGCRNNNTTDATFVGQLNGSNKAASSIDIFTSGATGSSINWDQASISVFN